MDWSEWNGDEIKAIIAEVGIRALQTCAQDLKGKSQEEAPVDLGDLKGNCHVSDVEESSEGISVRVGYSLPYALRQHEHPDYSHPKGGKAKYLEDPYKSNSQKYLNYIGKEIKSKLGD